MEKQIKTVESRQSETWYFIYTYLGYLYSFPELSEGEGYEKFKELENYVMEKMKLPYSGDIIETYRVIVQEDAD